MTQAPTRRERQREATYEEIVRVSRDLLAGGEELSLRAVAARMGVTAPALYRYVGSYQELVDLVAFAIDQAATEDHLQPAADRQDPDDPAAQILAAAVAFRRWALAHPREFSLVFANPVADTSCVRRELITTSASGHFFHDRLIALWHRTHFPHPELDDLPADVAEALRDPLLPVDIEKVPEGHRGMLWVFINAWAGLYGTVTLEVFGHMDPRIIQSGEMFAEMVRTQLARLGVDADLDRYEALLASELARTA